MWQGTNAKALEHLGTVSLLNTRARDAEVLAGSSVNLPWKNWWKWYLGIEQIKWLKKYFHEKVKFILIF